MLKAKPKRAMAVIATLIAVVFAAPSLLVILSLAKLETIVPKAIMADTIPAKERGTSKSTNIDGQAEPSIESGKPRLIKDKYITASSKAIIRTPK